MEYLTTVILESERLILQPISFKYAEIIVQEFKSKVIQYTYSQLAKYLNETQYFIAQAIKNLKNKTDLVITLLNKDNWDFLGRSSQHLITNYHDHSSYSKFSV